MGIEHVQVKELGTVALRKPSSTAGLVSGYQRTNIATSGVSVVETTGGYLLVEPLRLPWYEPLSLEEPQVGVSTEAVSGAHKDLAEGYRAMAAENRLLAEESLPVALEVWRAWEE